MSNVHDVAAYILEKVGSITAMKLQKLTYYGQAWSLVWEDRPLFGAQIQAWANGPVVPALYELHRRKFTVSRWPAGDSSKLSSDEADTVDAVIQGYGQRTSQELSNLTHAEAPWINAEAVLLQAKEVQIQLVCLIWLSTMEACKLIK